MNDRFAAILLCALSVTGVASCGERSQDLVFKEGHDEHRNEGWANQMRERTLSQGEGYRSDR